MDLSIFPTTASAVYTVAGAAVLCVLVTQWLKKYLNDSRWCNLIALCVTWVVVGIAAALLVTEPVGIGRRLFEGFLVGLVGASLATFGYEVLTNLAGIAGAGPRSTPTK